MMGGAALIGAFVDQDQIDEFIIHVIPTLIGEGIPLLGPGRREIQLSLRSCKHFSDGVVRLHYLVAKGTQGKTISSYIAHLCAACGSISQRAL